MTNSEMLKLFSLEPKSMHSLDAFFALLKKGAERKKKIPNDLPPVSVPVGP